MFWIPHPKLAGCPPGWPDLVVIGPRGALFRELKSATGTLSPAQFDVACRLADAGLDYDVWIPADAWDGTIDRELAAIAPERTTRAEHHHPRING